MWRDPGAFALLALAGMLVGAIVLKIIYARVLWKSSRSYR